jgi:hypothetical protein
MVTQNRHHGGRIVIDVKGRQEVVHFLSRLAISTFLLYIVMSVWLHNLGIETFSMAAIIAAITVPINLRNAKIGLIQFGITTAIAYVCSFWAVAGGINPLICILFGIPMRFPFFVAGFKYTSQQKIKDKPYNQMSRRELREKVQSSKAERDKKNFKKMEKMQAENQKRREKEERKRKAEEEFLHT